MSQINHKKMHQTVTCCQNVLTFKRSWISQIMMAKAETLHDISKTPREWII